MVAAITIVSVLVVVFLIHRVGKWADRQGWLYWGKPRRGAMGSALGELEAAFNPGARHVLEAKEQAAEEDDDGSD